MLWAALYSQNLTWLHWRLNKSRYETTLHQLVVKKEDKHEDIELRDIRLVLILEIPTGYRELNKVVKSPFKYFHSAFLPLKPHWPRVTAVCVAHFRNTHSIVLEMWKWNERRDCLVSLVICSPHCALFCSPGSLGESLIFSPTPWVPAAVLFVTVILSRPTGLLPGSVPASLWERERNRGRHGRSLVSRTFSRGGYIQGNNTFWTAGLQKWGVQ